MQKLIVYFIIIISFSFCKNSKSIPEFITNEGAIYGTYYRVIYESPKAVDLNVDIEEELHRLDMSLSTFKSESILTKVNYNKQVKLDNLFIKVFEKSKEISKLTNNAFDPTVAPLVNVWGFGFKQKQQVTLELIDSIMQFVGINKVKIDDGLVIKEDERLMLDFSAIAKGYSVDIIGELLAKKGCKNYLVEIGGEVVAKGINKNGRVWRIGINEPNDNEPVAAAKLQAIISLSDKAIATSGNYRNFYVENGKKYAHTINPHTGYPVDHGLLSASVLANDCMTADAYATAFMVLGVEKTKEIADNLEGIDVYLIYADENGDNQVVFTEGFSEYILAE